MGIKDWFKSRGVVRPRIFISYRRTDSGGYADQLLKALRNHYGTRSLFLDHATIEGGVEFEAELNAQLKNAQVVLAVIGPDWVAVEKDGERRLNDPKDWVRRELVASLERRAARVIPVLVGGATLPDEGDVPDVLRPMLQRQQRTVRPDRFDDDVKNLIGTIGGWRTIPRYVLAVGAVTLATAIGLILAFGPSRLGPMRGDFNVAIAEFTEETADGDTVPTTRSTDLSGQVASLIDDQLSELNATEFFGFEVRHPDDTGSVEGRTELDRAQAAEALAAEIGADVVVYGTLTEEGFAPKFHLRPRGETLRDAEELAGQYDLGARILSSDVSSGSITDNATLRMELTVRTQALVRFIVGLSWYGGREYVQALMAFRQADLPQWRETDGKEILHLFQGNAAGNMGDLDAAQASYDEALRLNEEYARAYIGRATVEFLNAKGDCEPGNADEASLRSAVANFVRAVAASDQPAISNVAVKAAFGKGRVYVCLSQALIEDRWEDAETEFKVVVSEYEGGNETILGLAIESYAGLGFVSLPFEGDPNPGPAFCEALAFYDTAASMSNDSNLVSSFASNRAFAAERLQELDFAC